MKLIYNVSDKPGFWKTIVFALQQVLAILAATIVVPAIINGNAGLTDENAMSQSAALFGAGVGTIVYLLFTKFKSPVFLGSSFAFIGSMLAAFGGAASASIGYFGILIGAIMAGLVYVIIAIIAVSVALWISGALTNSIDKVTPGSPAAAAGLQAGDTIAPLLMEFPLADFMPDVLLFLCQRLVLL